MASLDTPIRRHYLKKLLLTARIEDELELLAQPSALSHFGPPFRPDPAIGDVSSFNTKLPILRFVFAKFVTTFPFLQQTDQDSFWQDKVQNAFVNKRVSSSDDRAESTKRRKIALRLRSMLVLLMNAGVHAGQEDSITIEETEHKHNDAVKNLEINLSDRKLINGIDVNIAAVRTIVKPHRIRRKERHSEFIIRTRSIGKPDAYVARRYGAFLRLAKSLHEEFPAKQLARLPAKNKAASNGMVSSAFSSISMGNRDSIDDSGESSDEHFGEYSKSPPGSPRPRDRRGSIQDTHNPPSLPREKQRLSLRSYIRGLLADTQVAHCASMKHFLFDGPITLSVAEQRDANNRKDIDALRQEEQLRFLEVARQRAKELNVHMDIFKKDLISHGGLIKIFAAIKECESIEELPTQYIKVIEWARIEVAATLYQLFVADDSSSELFTQAKRLHSLFPYAVLKNIIRFSNPMTMMRAAIDLFLAQPFGRSSLFQRMFSATLTEDIKEIQSSIDGIRQKIGDDQISDKIKHFVQADLETQDIIRVLAAEDEVDLVIAVMRSEDTEIAPQLNGNQISRVFLANVAWTSALDGNLQYNPQDAKLFGYFIQLLKLYTRQRDKEQMLSLLFDGVTSILLKDIVSIFYEPLARVYKAASIHNSVMDFSRFVEDVIATVYKAEEQDLSTNPNTLVQSFIDLTGRHQNSFFHFVHEAHLHDDGLFDNLMHWIELILTFLREGTPQQLDLEQIFNSTADLDKALAIREIDDCIKYNADLKVWRQDRLRKRMAAETSLQRANDGTIPMGSFSGADFGLDNDDLDEMMQQDSDEEEAEVEDEMDPLEAARRQKKKSLARLNRRFGEPEMPKVTEVMKMKKPFMVALRRLLAMTDQ